MPQKSSRRYGSTASIKSFSSTGVRYTRPLIKVRSGREIAEFRKEVTLTEHEVDLLELIDSLGTDIYSGLTQKRADELLLLNGPNCIVETASKSKWLVLAGYLFGGFNTLLWLSAVLTFTSFGMSYSEGAPNDTLFLGIALLIVIFFTGFFGYYQECSNKNIMASFSKLIPKNATVIRDGVKKILPSEELVLGDIIEVRLGEVVPADIRIIEAQNLKVDNSSITGESIPVPRSENCTDSSPLETANLAFYSTPVVEGRGIGVVIRCGDNTIIGHIAGLTQSLEKKESLIHKEIKNFVKIITVLATCIAVTFFLISLLMGYDFFKSFTFFIAMLVANVPEGLPVTLTAIFTLTAKKMARMNCLIKKNEGMEALGSCNVICSDKTGTLTQNIMTVSHLYFDTQEWEVIKNIDDLDEESDAYEALCQVAILCSTASFIDKNPDVPIAKRKCQGDASESAILKLMEQLFGNVEFKREEYPKICEIPFNSTNKYQMSVHRLQDLKYLLVIKGAPERILDRCSTVLRMGEVLQLNEQTLKPIQRSILHLSNRGERVLALADYHLPPDKYHSDFEFHTDPPNFPQKGFRFLGLISLIDPPRPTVPDAVERCKSAGIRVIMVTGDHPVTALAIAKKVGIISYTATSIYDIAIKREISISKLTRADKKEVNAAVITGADLREMTEYELIRTLKLYEEIVFARTSPQQKLMIVEALQSMDMVVAVTGDGVNDSPALKKADIGIAMGITGSDVSKEAADMILMDDNFASIVTGIEQGRLIFDNLKKSIAYVLTSNVPEITPFMFMVLLNIPEALCVMTILVINLGTDLWPSISLAYERPEADIMKRAPRNPKRDNLLNHRLIYVTYGQIGVLQACASFASYFLIMARHGFKYERLIGLRPQWESQDVDLEDSYGRTWTYDERKKLLHKCYSGFFLSIVITQIADLLICKTRRLSLLHQGMWNTVLNAGIMFEPIDIISILPAFPYAIIIVVYDEFRKFCIRKYPGGFFYKETYY